MSTHQRLGILREHLKITRIKEKCFSAAEIYEESLEACRSNNAPAVHFCDLNLEEHLTALQNPGRAGCKNNAGPSLDEAMTYFLFNLLVSATQPAGKCSTTQQGPGQSPQQVPSPPSTARVTPPAAGGFVLPLLLSPSPLTAGTACSGAALSPLNEPKRLRNPQPGQGKAQPDPRALRCCPWAPACPAPLLSQHPPRFRWALRQVCSCFSNQNHLFRGLFFSKVLHGYGCHQ